MYVSYVRGDSFRWLRISIVLSQLKRREKRRAAAFTPLHVDGQFFRILPFRCFPFVSFRLFRLYRLGFYLVGLHD